MEFLALGTMFLLEPLLLSRFGTTAGKWLFGLRVASPDGRRLTYAEGRERTAYLFWYGIRLNLPVFRLYRLYVSYTDEQQGKALPWEDGSEQTIRDHAGWRFAAAAVLAALLIAGGVLRVLLTYGPANRGELTVAQFAENYNTILRQFGDYDVELDELDLESLNNIVNLCKENGIRILMYFVPMDSIDELNQKYRYKVWNYCEEKNIDYIDFVDLSEKLDYRIPIHNDGAHSRTSGASIITNYIANFLKENNYEFNHKDNELLNELYIESIDYMDYLLLFGEHNPSRYLYRIVNYPYLKLLRYNGSELNPRLISTFKDMNLVDLKEGRDYYAIMYGDKILDSGYEEISYDFDDNQIVINDSGIYVNDELIDDGRDIDIVVYNKNMTRDSIKKFVYSWGLLWDSDYDFNYNYKY